MDDDRPEVRALIAYPTTGGHVVLSRQKTVSLEDAVTYHRLGFIVLIDPQDESLLAEWERDQHWLSLRRWL